MPEIKFKAAFDLGEEVYVITDPMQCKGIILYVAKYWNGGILYGVKSDKEDTYEFQAVELSKEKDLNMRELKKEDPDEE